MYMACLDLEGVLVPEIWINVAKATQIEELKLTTRDVPDYDALMRRRLDILHQFRIGLPDIQKVIGQMRPLDGASGFLRWLQERFPVVILSDTYYEFALPLMRQLGFPTLLCNRLSVDGKGRILNYHLRQKEGKREAVKALKRLAFRVIACGDSYNDIGMLQEADAGILFRPPPNISAEYPAFPVTQEYDELRNAFTKLSLQFKA